LGKTGKECQVIRDFEVRASSEEKPSPDEEGRVNQESSELILLRDKTQLLRRHIPSNRTALGKRECEVLRLLAEGMSSKEIATLLNISVRTVETYRARISMKLDLHSVGQLIRYAVIHKIVQF
jgi:DNA-binding NarL/FixJ family response regulator